MIPNAPARRAVLVLLAASATMAHLAAEETAGMGSATKGWITFIAKAGDAPPSRIDTGAPARPTAGRVSRRILLVGVDSIDAPGLSPGSAADSPAASSGPFDAERGDLGEDDDLSNQNAGRRHRRLAPDEPSPADKVPDPLRDTPRIDPAATGADAARLLAAMVPERTDSPFDWQAPLEPLHDCGEPRALTPCVPPPPCHPSLPPRPLDLVGVVGEPSCGPIYRGPCAPRTGSHDNGPLPWLHRLHDRFVDAFYAPK